MPADRSSIGDEDPAVALRQKVRNGDLTNVKNMVKAGADYAAPGQTVRKWTALHIACWGSARPQFDREIAEVILGAAKKDGKWKQVVGAKDALDGQAPLDLVKEQRKKKFDPSEGGAVPAEGTPEEEEKRKFDKIIEWLEKGLPSAG